MALTTEKSPHEDWRLTRQDMDSSDGCDKIGIPCGAKAVVMDHNRSIRLRSA